MVVLSQLLSLVAFFPAPTLRENAQCLHMPHEEFPHFGIASAMGNDGLHGRLEDELPDGGKTESLPAGQGRVVLLPQK